MTLLPSFINYSYRSKILCLVYTLKILSVFVISLLLWFDFHRNIPCIRSSLRDTTAKVVPMKYPSYLNPSYLTVRRCVETLHNIYWFSPLQKPAKIYIICILNFNVSLCWPVGGKSLVFQDLVVTLFLLLNFVFYVLLV